MMYYVLRVGEGRGFGKQKLQGNMTFKDSKRVWHINGYMCEAIYITSHYHQLYIWSNFDGI